MRVVASFMLCMVLAVLTATSVHAQNFSHIKTFGYDYVDFSSRLDAADWIARRHDWIIGPVVHNLSFEGYRTDLSVYNTVKAANPDTRIMLYTSFNTVMPYMADFMEAWAIANGRNVEDLYYHYAVQTTVNTTRGTRTVPAGGRVPARWWGGDYPNINPTSQTFRDAYKAMALQMVLMRGSNDVYGDGLFLDTFNGTTERGYWSLHLQNTTEMRNLGITNEDDAIARVNQDLADAVVELRDYLKTQTGNPSFVVLPNAAEPSYMYTYYAELFETHNSSLNELAVEYLIRSTTNRDVIPYLRQHYDDMVSGRRLWIRSETGFTSNQRTIPFAFTQFIVASHYLINHANAWFSYHEGDPSNYGGTPYGDLTNSHWHPSMEVNIGSPVVRAGQDYWGTSNTDRFFVFAQGANYTILAREYSNALVLAKFGSTGGFDNIGTNAMSHALGGTYYPLLDDNALGAGITSVTLGNSEGVILMKDPDMVAPPQPANVSISYEVVAE